MGKRIKALLLALVLIVSTGYTEIPAASASTNSSGLSVSNTKLCSGDTFTVSATIPGISDTCYYMEGRVNFNKTAFELIQYDAEAITNTLFDKSEITSANTNGYFGFSCVSNSGFVLSDGYSVTATFKVRENVRGKYTFEIDPQYSLMAYDDADEPLYTNDVTSVSVQVTIPATKMSLDKTTLTLAVGEEGKLNATVTPATTTDPTTWTSSNETVATVDEDGVVTAAAKGNAIITARAGSVSADCQVTVTCKHAFVSYDAVAPTCVTAGNDAYKVCTICNQIFDANGEQISAIPEKSIDPAAHSYSEWIEEVKATCDTNGTKGHYTCLLCNKNFDANKNELTELTITHTPEVNTEEGFINDAEYHWNVCVCGATINKYAHSGGEATCKDRAVCEVCGVSYGELNADNHKGETEVRNAVSATCSAEGYTGDTYCTDCGVKIADGTVIAKLPHADADGKWENDGTNHWHTCECGEVIDTAAHSGGEATCKGQAVCEECGVSYGELNADNHKGETEVRNAVSATCSAEGYTGDTYCTDCGVKIADGTVIAKLPHADADGKWENDGTNHWHTCECGEVIDTAAHSITLVNQKDAACETDGYTGDKACSVCGYVEEQGEVIPATGHTLVKVEAKEATYEADGNIEYYKCECGKWFADAEGKTEITDKASVVIPQLKKGDEIVIIPTIDTTEPVEEVTVGVITNKETQGVLKNSVDEELKKEIETTINDGKDVITEVVITTINVETATPEVKADVEKALEKAAKDGVTIVSYLDLSIIVKTEDNVVLGTITETSEKLTFKIAIPEDLIKSGREFAVIRIHEGQVETLYTVTRDGYVYFETDAFSTYVLSYKDNVSEGTQGKTQGKTQEKTQEKTPTAADQKPKGVESPKTGDDIQMAVYYAALALAVVGIILLAIRKIRFMKKR